MRIPPSRAETGVSAFMYIPASAVRLRSGAGLATAATIGLRAARCAQGGRTEPRFLDGTSQLAASRCGNTQRVRRRACVMRVPTTDVNERRRLGSAFKDRNGVDGRIVLKNSLLRWVSG
jgi:hypothetical protein